MYLTKSLFKLSLECPTKVFYKTTDGYHDNKLDDPFLESLAEGGFQVGEMAKLRFPGGIDLSENNAEYAVKKTEELLEKFDRVTIYEAGFRYKNLYIKCDVLVKEGDVIKVYEVKSKSYNGSDFASVRSGKVKKEWEKYVYDVYFQHYVLSNKFPSYIIIPYLTMPDKRKLTTVDNLNQKFFISKSEEEIVSKKDEFSNETFQKTRIIVDKTIKMGEDIMSDIDVSELEEVVYDSDIHGMKFEDYIIHIAKSIKTNQKIQKEITKECFGCEFNNNDNKNGFKECVKKELKVKEDFFDDYNVCDIWNFRQKDTLIKEGKLTFDKLEIDDIIGTNYNKSKPEIKLRQWTQVKKCLENSQIPWVDYDALKKHLSSWKFPLHFIDFETTAIAIPFNKGMRPYEGIAFQFSHHTVDEKGDVVHAGEYINTEVGKFPNFEFVRKLKAELENDEGSIFMYSMHENSFLCAIYMQLVESDESDKDELCAWIQTITKPSSGVPKPLHWEEGPRYMVDLLEVVKECYYHIIMGGSNSIKYVLPAVLNSSEFLKKKYSKEDYNGFNFKDKAWIEYDNDGQVINPYNKLDEIFDDDASNYDLITSEKIADGGAAMSAYAKMQFVRMSDYERDSIVSGLKRYVELDTLSMCMIYEHFKELLDG